MKQIARQQHAFDDEFADAVLRWLNQQLHA